MRWNVVLHQPESAQAFTVETPDGFDIKGVAKLFRAAAKAALSQVVATLDPTRPLKASRISVGQMVRYQHKRRGRWYEGVVHGIILANPATGRRSVKGEPYYKVVGIHAKPLGKARSDKDLLAAKGGQRLVPRKQVRAIRVDHDAAKGTLAIRADELQAMLTDAYAAAKPATKPLAQAEARKVVSGLVLAARSGR
jgi:hypothetical protein